MLYHYQFYVYKIVWENIGDDIHIVQFQAELAEQAKVFAEKQLPILKALQVV